MGERDEAVVENVLLAYDANRRLQKEHLAPPMAVDGGPFDAAPNSMTMQRTTWIRPSSCQGGKLPNEKSKTFLD
jgi:hypothetical protein